MDGVPQNIFDRGTQINPKLEKKYGRTFKRKQKVIFQPNSSIVILVIIDDFMITPPISHSPSPSPLHQSSTYANPLVADNTYPSQLDGYSISPSHFPYSLALPPPSPKPLGDLKSKLSYYLKYTLT